MRSVLVALLLLVAAPVQAQMHVVVEADKIKLGPHEFVPRFSTFLSGLTVPAGQTMTLPDDSTHDAIEVAGTLRCSRTGDTKVRFIHLLMLPGGVLDCGTEDDPVTGTVEFIIRDVPIDTAKDPFQWGNGIVNFGTQTRVGRVKTSFLELADDAAQGATTITLATAPQGWAVGDLLVLPDTRQMGAVNNDGPPRRENDTRVAAIAGNVITLSHPLAFARASIRTPDGVLVLRPRVANLTRNITIRSENPAGVRGHTANIGHEASWDIRANQFIGVGRTTLANLNSTSVDSEGNITQIGGNQIGKYANHDHHTGTSATLARQNIGNTYQGTSGSKWGHVVHGTHDTLLEDEVCVDHQGGCFVTEDGYEVRNTFRHNFAAYVMGNGVGAAANLDSPRNAPGAEGSGFWFRGLMNNIEGNESWNNPIGMNLFSQDIVAPTTLVPTVKGGPHDMAVDFQRAVPILFDRNITAANNITGLEYWSVDRFLADNQTSGYNRSIQLNLTISQSQYGYFRNLTLIDGAARSTCLSSAEAYVFGLEIDGGRLLGCNRGLTAGLASLYARLRNVTLQNAVNIDMGATPDEFIHENVMHVQLGTRPKRFIEYGSAQWDGTSATPNNQGGLWLVNRGPKFVLKNWQGTGQDYFIADVNQLRTLPAWPAVDAVNSAYFCPERLTVGECWDKYGLAHRGFVVDAPVALDGLSLGLAAVPFDTAPATLGVPRAVLTWPNSLAPAPVTSSGSVKLLFTLTGDYTQADRLVYFSVDGGATKTKGPSFGGAEDQRTTTIAGIGTPGIHEVKTWRQVSPTSGKISGSELTFRYTVGTSPPPVEVCNADGTGNGVDEDGDGQIDEGCTPPPPVCPSVPPIVSVSWPGSTLPLTWGPVAIKDANGCTATVGQ